MTPDQILRQPAIQADYKLEFGWGANLTQIQDSTGARIFTASGVNINASFPAANVISGSNVSYNPAVDLDNNYCQVAEAGGSINIDAVNNFSGFFNPTELVIYFHPTLPISTNMILKYAIGASYITFFSGPITGRKMIIPVAGLIPGGARHIRMETMTGSSDGQNRVVAMELYNYSDETPLIVGGRNPDITVTSKSDVAQNVMPTPSDLTVTLNNIEGKFTARNPNSPLYGLQGPDGRGAGVKPSVPVRLTASATAPDGSSFSQLIYSGFIYSDDNPGGSTGINYDDINATVQFVCKSLLVKLTKNINVPSFEGASFSYIIKDICHRCGIADQDINMVNAINQGVPFVGFTKSTGISMINQMLAALPFMRAYETYSPWGQVAFVNFGRARTDIDLFRYNGSTGNLLFVPSLNASFLISANPSTTTIYKWDMTKPTGTGITFWGTISNPGGAIRHFMLKDPILYMVDVSGKVYHSDLSTTFNQTTDGTFGTSFVDCAMFGNFIYALVNGAGPVTALKVWDTTQAFSTVVNKGNMAHAVTISSNFMMGIDGTFLMVQYGSINHMVWKHNGTPYATALSNVDLQFFSSTVIGGENYTNVGFFFDQNEVLWGVVSILHSGDSLRRIEIWNLNIASAYVTPVNATKIGVIKDNTSALVVVSTAPFTTPTCSLILNGSYLYFADSENNQYVWDTLKDFSRLTSIGIGNQGNALPELPFKQAHPYLSNGTMGPVVNSIDATNRVWYANYNVTGSAPFVGFTVQNTLQFPTVPQASFDLSDNNTLNVQISEGNPLCNKIQLQTDLFQLGSITKLWTCPTTGLYFPSNKKTTQTIPLSGLSYRGYGNSGQTQRFIIVGGDFNNPVFDDPTTSTNVNLVGGPVAVTFFAYGDIAYLTLDNTNKVAQFLSIPANNFIQGKPLSQAGNSTLSVDVRDDVSFNLYGKEYVLAIQSPLFNDPSFYNDFLVYGKFARPYIQALALPWYPICTLTEAISVTDSPQSIVSDLHELVEYTHKGFNTAIKSKKFFPTFQI